VTARRFQRVARALYAPTLGMIAPMGDREVARLYTSMAAPTAQLAAKTFEAWEALPEDERAEATHRMRIELAKVAPRGRAKR
jgi:hypothetical protein